MINFYSPFARLLGTVLLNEAAADEAPAATGAAPVDAPEVKPTVDVGKPEEAPVPKPEPKDDDVLDKAGFAANPDDPGLTYALGFLAKNGFTSESPSVQAALSGDFSLLKAELATKGAAGWEQAVGLAEKSYEAHVKELDAQAEQVGKIVTGVAENLGVDWEAAVKFVAGSAKDEEKTALNGLLGNPATAHIAAAYISNAYLSADGVEVQPAAKAVADGASVTNDTGKGGPLSRREYTAEMEKLRRSMGDGYMDSPQAQALYRRLQR